MAGEVTRSQSLDTCRFEARSLSTGPVRYGPEQSGGDQKGLDDIRAAMPIPKCVVGRYKAAGSHSRTAEQ